MIELADLSVRYAGLTALDQVTVSVPEGELVLVVGPTGSGKTSLLRCLGDRSLYTDATVTGQAQVDDRVVGDLTSDALAGLVGFVAQDPASRFGASTVEQEVRRGLRHGPATSGRRRLEETLDLLGLTALRGHPLEQLSGGQQQRVAIATALASGPRILVLDEPTSALDPVAAEEVLAVLHRLVHDVGTTVVLAEHRLERVIHHADSVLLVEDATVSDLLDPDRAMARSALHPPVVALGLALDWSPLPLSVRAARARARTLAVDQEAAPPPPRMVRAAPPADEPMPSVVDVAGLSVLRGSLVALRRVSLRVRPGEVVAVMGRNGAGKSTLLSVLSGDLERTSGRVRVAEVARSPQDPSTLLTETSVGAQLEAADSGQGLPVGTCAAVLDQLAPGLARDQHPDHLSEGQRMCLALALTLAADRGVLLLDEPTRGLDYTAKGRLVEVLRERSGTGCALLVATHDVELAAQAATRALVLADGEVIADGPARDILAGSPAFAPQVSKIMRPRGYLTVDEVVAAAR